MIIVTKNEQIRTNILDYDFEEWDDFSSFLFSLADDKDWYYSSPVYEAELLGRPFATTVYYQPDVPNALKFLMDTAYLFSMPTLSLSMVFSFLL